MKVRLKKTKHYKFGISLEKNNIYDVACKIGKKYLVKYPYNKVFVICPVSETDVEIDA
jgi:hypothetical protein